MAPSNQFKASLTGRLFAESPQFRLAQLRRDDARKETDNQQILRNLLLENEPMYPEIGRWYKQKVLPGMRTGERIAYVAFEDERPIASAVLKLGQHAKFCHLRIHQDFQDIELGQLFFTLMAFESRHHIANDIHFTLPEGLWNSKADFFKSYGFLAAEKSLRQYRSGEAELSCSAPLSTVWGHALKRLPRLLTRFSMAGYSSTNRLLLSMRPEFAERVFQGTKQVEIRRKFSEKWVGSKAVIYGSKPLGALMGEVTVAGVTADCPNNIWERFGPRAGCSHDEFTIYVGAAAQVYAIELRDVAPYTYSISTDQIAQLINVEDLRPPQSFMDVKADGNSPWLSAISVAGLLHAKSKPKPHIW